MLRKFDMQSMMLKHWSLVHKESENPPTFRFHIVKCHSDPLSRLVHESVRIMSGVSMNSKAEYNGYIIPRLTVEKTDSQTKSDIDV